jgi:hypothetical protein
VHAAERFLNDVSSVDDPVVRALFGAREDDEPLSHDDREALEEGHRAMAKGDVISDEELRPELGI